MIRKPGLYLMIAAATLVSTLLLACSSDSEPSQPAAAPAAAQVPAPAPTAPPPAAAQPAPPTPTTAPPPPAGPAVASDIANFALEDLTIAAGTTVTWTNQDGAPHTVTSGTPGSASGLWDSRNLSTGGEFSFTFSQVGTFAYFCNIHQSMTGTVTVTESGSSAALAPTAVPPTATPPPPTATAVPPAATPTTAPPPPEGPALASDIANFALEDLTIAAGTTVTWTNQDGATHTVTSGPPGAATGLWDSGNLSRGGQFSFTFSQVGTFAYFCNIHQSMTATVTVTESGSSAALAPTATAVPPSPTPAAPPPPSDAQLITSDIANFALEDLTVNVGTKVTWTNKDGAPHTTTSGAPGALAGLWDSGTLSQDGQFSFTFSEVGTFPYFCAIHTFMVGTVTVVESGASAQSTSGDGDGYE